MAGLLSMPKSKRDRSQILEVWQGQQRACRVQNARAEAGPTLESLAFLGSACGWEYQNTAPAVRLLPRTASDILNSRRRGGTKSTADAIVWLVESLRRSGSFRKGPPRGSPVYCWTTCDVVELSCGGPDLDAVSAVPPQAHVSSYTSHIAIIRVNGQVQ